ncbi:MAG TPA: hypothetical protein VLZ89_09750 [Anaerolineales bacterium]|nr:hypothetical protein [Anaerolineales bacterium]
MIRRNTWILLIVLAALVGAALYFNRQQKSSAGSTTPTPANTFLFTSKDGNPTDIKIQDTEGHSVEVARDSTGKWVLKAPTADAANQSQAEAAATQLTSLNLVGNVQIGLDVVGLDKPTYTMTITFDSAKTHKVLIGSVNPIQTGYYIQVDGGPVQVAEKSGIDSLVGMLTAPPYLATLTPTITLTPIPSDTEVPPASSPTALPGTTAPFTPTGAAIATSAVGPSTTATP